MSRELVRAIYDPLRKLPEYSGFYKEAISEVDHFGIASQIYYLLKKTGQLERTPYFFQNQLEDKYKRVLSSNIFIKNKTEELLKVFEYKRVEVISMPLKGTGLSEKYFQNAGARPASHIDLLVKKKDLSAAIKLVNSLGYKSEKKNNERQLYLSFRRDLPGSEIPLRVELHWSIIREDTASFAIDQFWGRAGSVEGYYHVKELSDCDAFYFICLHSWRHNLHSLRHFVDILQMIHFLGEKIDYQRLLALARSQKTYKRIVRTLSIVYREFPHLNLVNPLPRKKLLLFWDYQALLPGSRKKVKHYLDQIDHQYFSYDTLMHHLTEPKNQHVHLEQTLPDN